MVEDQRVVCERQLQILRQNRETILECIQQVRLLSHGWPVFKRGTTALGFISVLSLSTKSTVQWWERVLYLCKHGFWLLTDQPLVPFLNA